MAMMQRIIARSRHILRNNFKDPRNEEKYEETKKNIFIFAASVSLGILIDYAACTYIRNTNRPREYRYDRYDE